MTKAQKKQTSGWIFKTLFILALTGTFLVSLAGAALYWTFSRDLPKIITVADYRPLTATRIFTAKGTLVGEFYKERRYVIPYEKIPPLVVKAFISAEDDKFFEHQGINL